MESATSMMIVPIDILPVMIYTKGILTQEIFRESLKNSFGPLREAPETRFTDANYARVRLYLHNMAVSSKLEGFNTLYFQKTSFQYVV